MPQVERFVDSLGTTRDFYQESATLSVADGKNYSNTLKWWPKFAGSSFCSFGGTASDQDQLKSSSQNGGVQKFFLAPIFGHFPPNLPQRQ